MTTAVCGRAHLGHICESPLLWFQVSGYHWALYFSLFQFFDYVCKIVSLSFTDEIEDRPNTYLSQRTTKPTIKPVWHAKSQISLYIYIVTNMARVSFISLWIALLNRISHGTDSSHVWKIRSDLSRGVKNSTEFFTAAERIPHLSVTNSFGISFIYSTQTYLSLFKTTLKKVPFFHARISHKRICHSLWYKTYD